MILLKDLFPFCLKWSHFTFHIAFTQTHIFTQNVDHIYTNFVMYLGEEDLPDSLDARRSSWLGLGERCSALYEMGHTYR